MSSPCASTQASASCAGVQPLRRAIAPTAVDQVEVALRSCRPGSAGDCRRQSSALEVVGRADLAGQEAAAERAVGDEADAQLAHRRQDLGLRLAASTASTRSAAPRSGARRARGGSSPAPPRTGPRKRTLPARDELGHRADRLLDRRLRVDAVLVVEVDRVDAEPLQADASQACAHVVGPAVDAQALAVRRRARCRTWWRARPRRGGPRSPGRPAPRCVHDAVHVGRVEEVDAELQRPVDGGDRLGLVAAGRRSRACPCSRGRSRRPGDPAVRAVAASSFPPAMPISETARSAPPFPPGSSRRHGRAGPSVRPQDSACSWIATATTICRRAR